MSDLWSRIRRRVVASAHRARKYVAERIQSEKPDLVLNHDMTLFDSDFFRPLKPYIRHLVGQHACTEVWSGSSENWLTHCVRDDEDYTTYDCVVSSMPSSVSWFQTRGANAFLSRLAIDIARIDEVTTPLDRYETTFIGSFSKAHTSRLDWISEISSNAQVSIWAPRSDASNLQQVQTQYMGEAFGRKMFEILKSSRVTLNHHGNTRDHANNMRLYEATACRTALITDWKSDIAELFEPGKEVLTYRSPEECVEQIERLIADSAERNRIAGAGRSRCQADHTYEKRMIELLNRIND
jgi:spore maturation protein CgeB